jgi:hypothetical protein
LAGAVAMGFLSSVLGSSDFTGTAGAGLISSLIKFLSLISNLSIGAPAEVVYSDMPEKNYCGAVKL